MSGRHLAGVKNPPGQAMAILTVSVEGLSRYRKLCQVSHGLVAARVHTVEINVHCLVGRCSLLVS